MPEPTLRARYSDQLVCVLSDAAAPLSTDLGEKRGWLLRAGVPDIVQPFLTHSPDDDADLARYAGLDAAAAADLLDRLTPVQLEDRQNDGPTLGTLLLAAVAHPDDVEVHGYLIGPARRDERITAEGVDIYGALDLDITPGHHADRQCRELWELVQNELGIDDARCRPDEITPRINPWRPNEPCWSLWWD